MLTLPASTTTNTPRSRRVAWSLLAFRTFAALVALTCVFVIQVWRKVLIPWLPYGESDPIDYGWVRHAELFVVPDTAAAVFQFGLGIAAFLVAVRPLGRSAVISWLAAGGLMIAWAGMFTAHFAGSSLVDTTIQGMVLTVGLCIPLVFLHPQRTAVLRGGLPDQGAGPGNLLRLEMALIGLAGISLAMGSILWRASGGVFENPREDSVLSLVMFGLILALGALLCWRGKQGWRTLAYILNGMIVFSLAALVTITFF